MNFDLSAVVALDATGTYSLQRYSIAYDSNGLAVSSPNGGPISVELSVQPISGDDLQLVPEGVSAKSMLSVFSYLRLQVDDEITIGTDTYQVMHVDDWGEVAQYWRAVVLKVQA